MSEINILDDYTISKIAAGEIIENPASIVKEMLENAIDAGAKNITIEIKGSVVDHIRITDDGRGMSLDDLNLAFKRHSTSKLKSFEDLDNIISLGFRGEALPSISHVSNVEVITKTNAETYGIKATINGSDVTNSMKVGAPEGTTFHVRNVFDKVPVRKKYLKSERTELSYIVEVVEKISLGHPNMAIKLIKDNKIIINSKSDGEYRNHIFSILGKDIASNLTPIEFMSQSYTIKGFISNNQLYRSNRSHQYIYINNRYVRNLEISRNIEKYYHTLIPLNRFPIFILFINIDPMLVDVNIHPKKHEVKLSNENNLLDILNRLLEHNLISKKFKSINRIEPKLLEPTIFELYKDAPIQTIDSSKIIDDKQLDYNTYIPPIKEDEYLYNINNTKDNKVSAITPELSNEMDEKSKLKEISEELILQSKIVGIIFKTYIILENSSKDKIFLIDQHAAHERILYEKYKDQFLSESLSRQILLTPEIIELSPSNIIILEDKIELLEKLGFLVEKFSETSMVLREVPIIFGAPTFKNMIYDIISQLSNIKSPIESDLYKIMRRACRSAVKAGDTLSHIEVESLIIDLFQCNSPFTCPHGRPTVIEVSKHKIEEIFLRD